MKHYLLLLIVIFLAFTQCKEKIIEQDIKNKVSDVDTAPGIKSNVEIKNNEVLIPNLKVVLYLSNDAIQKLQENKETVIASLLFYGNVDDEDTLPEEIRKDVGPDGLQLGTFEIEEKNISKAINFSFDSLIIPKKLYDKLTDKDISLNINVFSGRKHFTDNILNTESFDSKISHVISKDNRIKLHSNLLPETIGGK